VLRAICPYLQAGRQRAALVSHLGIEHVWVREWECVGLDVQDGCIQACYCGCCLWVMLCARTVLRQLYGTVPFAGALPTSLICNCRHVRRWLYESLIYLIDSIQLQQSRPCGAPFLVMTSVDLALSCRWIFFEWWKIDVWTSNYFLSTYFLGFLRTFKISLWDMATEVWMSFSHYQSITLTFYGVIGHYCKEEGRAGQK